MVFHLRKKMQNPKINMAYKATNHLFLPYLTSFIQAILY